MRKTATRPEVLGISLLWHCLYRYVLIQLSHVKRIATTVDMCWDVINVHCQFDCRENTYVINAENNIAWYRRINLVDPASSYMLVSKAKPCMCVHKFLHSETANGSITQSFTLWNSLNTWTTAVILELIHDPQPASTTGSRYQPGTSIESFEI